MNIIKSWYNISDERVTQEIAMNPYLQYFLGLTEHRYECPFHPSEMSRFRKRVSPELMMWVNDMVIGRPKESSGVESNDEEAHTSSAENDEKKEGTLILDATCVPHDIRFPTDASLLNEARLNAEESIDIFHKNGLTDGKKPRTYRKKARNQYNSFSKSRKKSRKSIRKAVKQQLGYLRRDLEYIRNIVKKHPESLSFLPKRKYIRLLVIQEVYRQQNEMKWTR